MWIHWSEFIEIWIHIWIRCYEFMLYEFTKKFNYLYELINYEFIFYEFIKNLWVPFKLWIYSRQGSRWICTMNTVQYSLICEVFDIFYNITIVYRLSTLYCVWYHYCNMYCVQYVILYFYIVISVTANSS